MNKPWLKVLIIAVIVLCFGLAIYFSASNGKKIINDIKITSQIDKCPEDLTGLVTYQIMDKGAIKGLVPLGNSNPPGHTFPVDHIYFKGDAGTKYNVYASGDGVITDVVVNTAITNTDEEVSQGFTVTIKFCDTVALVNAIPGEPSKVITDVTNTLGTGQCKTFPAKHEGKKTETQCSYNVSIKVKADDIIGTTDGVEFPEIWALDYNRDSEDFVDWERYNSPYYEYAFCFFDMYPQELKDYYYQFFGSYEIVKDKSFIESNKEVYSQEFIPRTIEPKCGKVMQNIAGTAKGDWFGEGRIDTDQSTVNIYDLALIENNLNPLFERIVIGGTITDQASLLPFLPQHSGTINRAFEEVTADGKTYCYELRRDELGNQDVRWVEGKIVLQLVDEQNLLIEWQDGECSGGELLIAPHKYDR